MLDVSSIRKVKGFVHWSSEINQLYHPTGAFEQEGEGIVYSSGELNKTKFVLILLKEWFCLVKKNGYLIIDYQPNKICDWQKLEEFMWWLWKDKYEIVYHGPVGLEETSALTEEKLSNFIRKLEDYWKVKLDQKSLLPPKMPTVTNPAIGGQLRFIVRKKRSLKIKGDDITKWSFGIITDGRRIDWIEKIIVSIKRQKIPEFEIIVCGNYFRREEKNFIYIPFNQRDDKGWITRKKNLMAERASYENLCFLHDRVVLDDGWYQGMKRWGNCFDLLSCEQEYDNKRGKDWLIWERTNDYHLGFASLMNYKDWDKDIYQSGQLHILKKHIAREVKWTETSYWGDLEDVLLTKEARDKGYLLRFNQEAKCLILKERIGSVPTVSFDKLQLSKKREGKWLQVTGRKICLFFGENKFLRKIILYLLVHFPIKW